MQKMQNIHEYGIKGKGIVRYLKKETEAHNIVTFCHQFNILSGKEEENSLDISFELVLLVF